MHWWADVGDVVNTGTPPRLVGQLRSEARFSVSFQILDCYVFGLRIIADLQPSIFELYCSRSSMFRYHQPFHFCGATLCRWRRCFLSDQFLPCDAMNRAAIAVTRCLSVRPSVTFMSCAETNKDIFQIFSPSGSDIILVFPYQRGCRMQGGMIKCRFFHKYLAVSQKRLYLDGHMQQDNL